MKILVSIIVILIIIIALIISFNSNIYFSEDFSTITDNSYKQNTIEDLISLSYVPNNPYEKEKINEYDVIEIYKKILLRSPTDEEIKLKVFLTKEELTEDLYNSYEYDKISKLQTTDVNNLEISIAKRNLSARIYKIYKSIYKKNVPDRMIIILRDCYIHLRSNYYLFLSLLEHNNYPKFENELMTSISLTKKKVLDLFIKYFNYLELKLLAEAKIKSKRGVIDKSKDIEDIESKLKKLNLDDEIEEKENKKTNIDINELQKYLNNDNKKTDNNSTNKKSEIITKSNKTSDNSNATISLLNPLAKSNEKSINKSNDNQEVYVRVYDPINYKQTYRGPAEFKPPICTSLGQPSLEVPVFLDSKLLYQGYDINKAFEETQVGSIMPKFEYREYQDIRIK